MAKTEQEILENYKKRLKRQNDAVKNKYDRVSVTLPKGTRDKIISHGYTINGFINDIVIKKLSELENK